MKKKYILSLCLIGFLLIVGIGVSVGYGLWINTKKEAKESTTLNCFRIYYSNSDGTLERRNVKPVVNEEGKETSPITLTVTNICQDPKELQLRLNITKESNLNIDGLTLQASGHIEKDIVLYNDLISTKTTDPDVTSSKLIGSIKVEPGETVRTNIKYWFDERKTPNLDSSKVFMAKFELIDTESSIKPTFAETLLADNKVNKEKTVDFTKVATTDEGLNYTTDDKGEIYYFRGNSKNNYLQFAGLTWRILRINSDKSIRIVLDHNITFTNYSRFNNAIDYTGLKYVYNAETINNDISNVLNDWYYNTITVNKFDNYVVNSGFCNDSSSWIERYHTYFNNVVRINNHTPSYTCPGTNNDFGGLYNQKIGLISVDDAMYAGAVKDLANTSYFLYSAEPYYTMSPIEYYNYRVYLYYMTESGTFGSTEPTNPKGVRPVINISPTVSVIGKGTQDNPYVIDNS